MIMYRTNSGKIEAREVIRETGKTVILPPGCGRQEERRESKCSGYQNWHYSWEEAKQFLVAEAEQEVETIRGRLERAKSKLGNLRGMKEPK
jgi:hypothetical protein